MSKTQPPPYYPGTANQPQQGFAPPPQQGYAPPSQQGYPPQQYGVPPQQGYAPPPTGAQTVVVQQVATGNCPACRNGMLIEDYTCCGIFLAIFFFPLGILCCLAMRERRCTNCHASF